MKKLHDDLMRDLVNLGIRTDFDLELKKYSKTYFGRYNPNKNRITLYVYESKDCKTRYAYKNLLLTLVHEVVHHMQWGSKSFIRVKGVMHNCEFHHIFNKYKKNVCRYLQEKDQIQ